MFNVLILHRMGDPICHREAVRSLEYMIPECRPDLNCIVHDADLPFPEYLKEIDYHLIVLGPTFLCSRYQPSLLSKTLKEYSFIGEAKSCKVALPQDDYDCSAILDEWMIDWGISRIYTVCPDHWGILYPRAINAIEIKLGYTGYVSDEWINAWETSKIFSLRSIDVSYRATKLPANFGRSGQLKYEIAGRFKDSLIGRKDLVLDISVKKQDLVPGVRWHSFLENSKFCLATPSGSSILDSRGEIRNLVRMYSDMHPGASFNEIEKQCFKGQDGKYLFHAISPRNIEAALAETVQIATVGSYSSLMLPNEDYIALDENCSNINEVLEMMNDQTFIAKLRKQCKESILSEPRLRRKAIVAEIIEFAEDFVSHKNIKVSNQNMVEKSYALYHKEIAEISKAHWKRQRLIQKMKKIAVNIGARRVRGFFLTRSSKP